MATRSTFTMKNPNGTFSSRYHHWDGYCDGLGDFLHENVNTPTKVKWLFNLKRSFSSIMNTIPDENDPEKWRHSNYKHDLEQGKDNIAHWPSLFGDEMSKGYLSMHSKDDSSIVNRKTWAEIEGFCQEEYNYVFDKTWKLIVRHNTTLENSVCVDVPLYVLCENFLNRACEIAPEQWSLEAFQNSQDQTNNSYAAQEMVEQWHALPLEHKIALWQGHSEYLYGEHRGRDLVAELDAWIVRSNLHDQIGDVAATTRKILKI